MRKTGYFLKDLKNLNRAAYYILKRLYNSKNSLLEMDINYKESMYFRVRFSSEKYRYSIIFDNFDSSISDKRVARIRMVKAPFDVSMRINKGKLRKEDITEETIEGVIYKSHINQIYKFLDLGNNEN